MKKALKIALYVLLGLVVLIGGTLAFISIRGIPTYTPQKIALKVEPTPERLARGKHLVGGLCAGCHMDPTTQLLTGREMKDAPTEFGVIYSRNITQDPVNGIGTWTDGELAYLLRTGVKRDGIYVPLMGGFIRMSDEDIYSIIAFLRSNDPLVRPVAVADRGPDYSLLAKVLGTFVFSPNEYPTKPIAAPDIHDKVAYGKYIVTGIGDCFGCHSEDFKTIDMKSPEKSGGYLAGGMALRDYNGRTVYSRNLTPDPETGIGTWTEAQFIRAVRDGFRPDNTPLRYPMERYNNFSEEEIAAAYAYLRTVPAIRKANMVSEEIRVADANATAGKEIYYKYACYSCQGETGVGTCDLRGAAHKYASNDSLISWIRDPSKMKPDTKMPTWEGVIKDEEFLPLAEYVRQLGERSGTAVANR